MNLDRLKGTDLLMDGFEEFLSSFWFAGTEPKRGGLVYTKESNEVFSRLPYAAKRFYQIDHRWPMADIRNDAGDVFYAVGQPRFARTNTFHSLESNDGRSPYKRRFLKEKNFARLVGIPLENREICICLTAPHIGALYFNDFRSPIDEWTPVGIPLDEFLVSLAFSGMFTHGQSHDQPSQGNLIFFGRFHLPEKIEVFQQDDLISYRNQSGQVRCCRRPVLV